MCNYVQVAERRLQMYDYEQQQRQTAKIHNSMLLYAATIHINFLLECSIWALAVLHRCAEHTRYQGNIGARAKLYETTWNPVKLLQVCVVLLCILPVLPCIMSSAGPC